MSIVITDLCKSFGSSPVLRRFTWTVDRPMVLMGRSGCGKTTLLRILLGLESADSGTVTGVETPAAVFQEDRLCPQLTAAANLTLTGHGLPPQDAERELRALGFTDAELALPAARLSGGQKRRIAIAGVIAMRPKVLILDEPTAGLDPAGCCGVPLCCARCSAAMRKRSCWTSPSPAWTPSLSRTPSPPQNGWRGSAPRSSSPMTAPPPTCSAGR